MRWIHLITSERERESKQVRRLVIVNLLLIITVAFLIKVVFDLAKSLENPPRQSGVFVLPSPESNQGRIQSFKN